MYVLHSALDKNQKTPQRCNGAPNDCFSTNIFSFEHAIFGISVDRSLSILNLTKAIYLYVCMYVCMYVCIYMYIVLLITYKIQVYEIETKRNQMATD